MSFQYYEHVLHCGHTCITDSEEMPDLCPYCDKKYIDYLQSDAPGALLDSYRIKNGTPYCVYLISDGFYTKIGVTKGDATERLKELQTGNARKLHVIGIAGRFRVRYKAFEFERSLHKIYSKYQCEGEWFNLSKQQIESITKTTIQTGFYTLKEIRKKFSRNYICPNCGAPLAFEEDE